MPCQFGIDLLARRDRILGLFLYHATTDNELLALAARIMDLYAEFYATRGIYYTGVFRATGVLGNVLAEPVVYDAPSQEEAERLGSDDLPKWIEAIDEEYHALMDHSHPRYLIWLLPNPSTSPRPASP
ncbi:MAG: hypothetical protein ACJ78Q_05405 [Chloroflexia bacterium]